MNLIEETLAKARETHKKRIAICKECPELRENIMQCKKCGCFVNAKAIFADMHCPLDKW
jgi:hypothetical protein|tara:strand:+ start:1747 stop:1923 length:177 start_codon:yes stop_codon:yes gene_type:complete